MNLDQQKEKASRWFEELRTGICETYEALENDYQGALKDIPAGKFERNSWTRDVEDICQGHSRCWGRPPVLGLGNLFGCPSLEPPCSGSSFQYPFYCHHQILVWRGW